MDSETNLRSGGSSLELYTPVGVMDIYDQRCAVKERIERQITDTFHSYGFKSIETPTFEFFDVFGREKGTVPSKQMFKFFDRDNNTIVLRPDITPGAARCVSRYFHDEEMPIRMCYLGNTFVNVPPYKGKLQEVTQAGAEFFNDDSSDADAEMIAIMADACLKSGLHEFQLEVGHAGFMRGLLDETGLDRDGRSKLIDMISRKNFFGVVDLLEDMHVSQNIREIFSHVFDDYHDDLNSSIDYILARTDNDQVKAACDRLKKVSEKAALFGIDKYLTVDLSLLSTYKYYTGVIFKAYTSGSAETVASGGRYDGLVKQFGKEAPAVGFAINTNEVLDAVLREDPELLSSSGITVLLYNRDSFDEAINKAEKLREKGKAVRLVRKSSKLDDNDYRAYADRLHADELIVID
jgi:ATP phosphoribosyltransferase regulatory subunit